MPESTITRTLFSYNTAAGFGAIILNFAPLRIEESVFKANRARNSASGLVLSDSKVHIQDSQFASIEQSQDFPHTGGFVVLISQSEASLERCVLVEGKAAEGGAIKVLRESYLFVNNCTFKRNEATTGGDIYAFNHKSIVVKNSEFS